MGRRTVLLITAIVVAALGTGLIFAYVNRTDERARKDQELVEVIVAKKLIRAGTTGRSAEQSVSFDRIEVPRALRIDGALEALSTITDLVAISDIFPGEQIIEAKFAKAGTAGALPIPTGKVAVSVQLGDPQRVAGFVKPGSDVGIFLTVTPPATPGQPAGDVTRVLLSRISVLAVGPTTLKPATGSDANKEAVPTAILTLAVDQAQAQKLIFGAQHGALYFVLMTKDSKLEPGTGTDIRTLFS